VLTGKGETRRIPVDPDGRLGLTGEEADPYRIEIETVSAAIAGGVPLEFAGADAIAQAATFEALNRAARSGTPVDL
jgi:predicted dehydrogenase